MLYALLFNKVISLFTANISIYLFVWVIGPMGNGVPVYFGDKTDGASEILGKWKQKIGMETNT